MCLPWKPPMAMPHYLAPSSVHGPNTNRKDVSLEGWPEFGSCLVSNADSTLPLLFPLSLSPGTCQEWQERAGCEGMRGAEDERGLETGLVPAVIRCIPGIADRLTPDVPSIHCELYTSHHTVCGRYNPAPSHRKGETTPLGEPCFVYRVA